MAPPWWMKIGAKLVLSRLAFDYSFWSSKLGIFRHGHMDRAVYSRKVFDRHFNYCVPAPGFTCLELGPGDALSTAVLAKTFGAGRTWLVDVAAFATRNLAPYRALADELAAEGRAVPDLAGAESLEAILIACDAQYLTLGLSSLRSIPDQSIDFAFSQSCLEHVRLHEFTQTVRELRRITANGGLASHRIDLMDHLAKNLNNLRFPPQVWESDLMADSGFYTNRLRFSQIIRTFEAEGFAVEVVEKHPFAGPRLAKASMDPMFRDFDDDDLDVAAFTIRCRPI